MQSTPAAVTVLERIRHARGLSREQLAAQAEVSPRAIAYAEREGVRPRRATARALAAALGIDAGWLTDPTTTTSAPATGAPVEKQGGTSAGSSAVRRS